VAYAAAKGVARGTPREARIKATVLQQGLYAQESRDRWQFYVFWAVVLLLALCFGWLKL